MFIRSLMPTRKFLLLSFLSLFTYRDNPTAVKDVEATDGLP